MKPIAVYSSQTSKRLQYVLDWLFNERLGTGYTLITDEAALKDLPFFIAYGDFFPNALSIPAVSLLWENEVKPHTIPLGVCGETPCLYDVNNPAFTLPFDMLASIFFLLSRYEEYSTPYTPDKHGRYPATESLLYKNGWLRRPLLDEWVAYLVTLLQEQYKLAIEPPAFTFQPTYDIDIAYSYRYKGFQRALGGFLKDLSAGKLQGMQDRAQVLLGNMQDPYDSYNFISELHKQNKLTPLYFILAALRPGPFDKNISPANNSMQELIKRLAYEGTIGVHPSYDTDKTGMLYEKEILEQISGERITISRQHYIRLFLPHTYRSLIKEGIHADYSMGYGTQLGFRAGTGSSFLWYDLKNEVETKLRVYPFCFMDTTAHYEEKLSAKEAFAALRSMRNYLQKSGSMLITIFHNFSLGQDPEWEGWTEAYENFLSETAQ